MFKRLVLVASLLLAVPGYAAYTEEEKEQIKKACDDGRKQIKEQIDSGGLNDDACAQVSTTIADDANLQAQYEEACANINLKNSFGNADTCDKFLSAYDQTCNDIINCGGGSDPCFPSAAVVTLSDGATKPLDSLKEGDSIVATTAEGVVTTDTVSVLSLAKPAAHATFVKVTANKTTIHLTGEHRLPFGDVCCSMLKRAKDVQVGDKIWTVAPGAKAPTMKKVTAKSSAFLQGLHSPVLTNGGFPVVDGVVTSFDDLETVTLAKNTLKYLLPVCKATGTCNLFRRTFLNADRQYIDEAPIATTTNVARRMLRNIVEKH